MIRAALTALAATWAISLALLVGGGLTPVVALAHARRRPPLR